MEETKDVHARFDAVDTEFGVVDSLGPIWMAPEQTPSQLVASVIGRSSESALTCKKCNSKQVTYTLVQRRSPDEPMTALARCNQCGARWSEG